jgi:glycosyltransferase involved in cell wall biosynthesis
MAGDPFLYYSTARNFTVTTIAVPDLVHLGRVGFVLAEVWFSERARWLKSFWLADIVYSRDAGVLLQYLLLGRTLVYEAHTKPSRVARFVARRAKRVVVISKALEAAYEAAGVKRERITTASDAYDPRLFADALNRTNARRTLGFAAGERLVVYTGHFYIRKGAATLAEAATLMPDTHFVFVGGTPKDIEAFRARWEGQTNITAVGHIAPQRVVEYLRAADVLVLPNSGRDEDANLYTSPMKLFEYMASGTPIVASRVPAILEVLSESEAYFFNPDDPKSLAAALKGALADPEASARALRAEAKAKGYTWAARARTILGALRH